MNNQGLEALAALASAAPASPENEPRPAEGQAKDKDDPGKGDSATQASATATNPATAPSAAAQALQQTLQQHQQQQHSQQSHPYSYGQLAGLTLPAASKGLSNADLGLLAGMQQLQRSDPSVVMAMHNAACYQLLMQSQIAKGAAQQLAAPSPVAPVTATQLAGLMAMARGGVDTRGTQLLAASQTAASEVAQHANTNSALFTSAVKKSALPKVSAAAPASSSSSGIGMPPPSSPNSVSAQSSSGGGANIATSLGLTGPPRSLLVPQQTPARSTTDVAGSEEDGMDMETSGGSEDKKELKRAANRRSAQLSRKRKKQFIEELKEENDDLRRKEQILRSIPDLVVVFDSTGKLWFVSQSVSKFLRFSPEELEGKSFWERLCPDSVRLVKAAFMDSLAARESTTDTVPLGSGMWELRLVDKDSTQVLVTLNGVVHFAGERPECVCCIRPKNGLSMRSKDTQDLVMDAMLSKVDPHQSVVTNTSNNSALAHTAPGLAQENAEAKGTHAVRISDSGGSGDSEGGGSD